MPFKNSISDVDIYQWHPLRTSITLPATVSERTVRTTVLHTYIQCCGSAWFWCRSGSYPKSYACWKIRNFFITFIHSSASLHCLTFLLSVIGDITFTILDSFPFGWNGSGSGKMMLNPNRSGLVRIHNTAYCTWTMFYYHSEATLTWRYKESTIYALGIYSNAVLLRIKNFFYCFRAGNNPPLGCDLW